MSQAEPLAACKASFATTSLASSICIKVNLFQSLVIAHNSAPPDQWNPYMRWALRPLNPVVLLGVTGKSTEAPTMRRQYSVMQWWKAPP